MQPAAEDDEYFEHVLDYAEPGRVSTPSSDPVLQWREWWRRRSLDCADTALGRLARTQGFVLISAQLRTHGLERHDLRREERRGTWWTPARGVHSPVVPPIGADAFLTARRRHALTGAAAALTHPDHLLAARSAAIVHGLPTLKDPRRPELIGASTETTGRRQRVHVRTGPFPAAHRGDWYGAATTQVARTVVDLARFDRRDGLMAADAALRTRLTTRTEIARVVRDLTGMPGIRAARDVLPLGSPLAESALESLTRLAMHDDGFPQPELQVVIETHAGSYRVDMLFRESRLIVEIDGLGKYTDTEFRREKVRESRLRAAGYRVERVIWEDVLRYWPRTRLRLWAALAG